MAVNSDRKGCWIWLAWLTVVSGIVIQAAPGDYQTPTMPRVRSDSPVLSKAIERGIGVSPTFQRLVESIDSSDGVVYILEGLCGRGVKACLLLNVTVAGPYRLLHIKVDPRKQRDAL